MPVPLGMAREQRVERGVVQILVTQQLVRRRSGRAS